MLGGKQKRPLGYTIVEVMIVLAISGIMFLIATQFINGKQAKSSFTEGVNDMASQIQDVIEQVSDGRYSDAPLTCSYSGSVTSAGLAISPATAQAQGTNPDCVFVGKVFSFKPGTATYEVISLAGNRIDPQSSADANVSGIAAIDAEYPAMINGLTVTQDVPQALTIGSLTINAGGTAYTLSTSDTHPAKSYYPGFVQGAGNVSSGQFEGGASGVSLIYFPVSHPYDDSYIGSSTASAADSVTLCLTDGAQFADIDIGSSYSVLNVTVDRQVTSC